MKLHNNKIIIIGILTLSFLLTRLFSSTVFMSNSPRLNKSFFLALKNNTFNFLASLNRRSTITKPETVALQNLEQLPSYALRSVGKGVYAKEDAETNVVYIRITKDAEWEEKIISFEGKQVKVRVPKGTFK